ncbi:MAG: acyltransferase, partial [Pseudomonadota bacterium]
MTNGSLASGYLRHVDGLRGVSVLLVVFYHAWPKSLPGGFIGVDVFFVISGFLITRLLVAEVIDTGRINYGRFLVRRVRRLWPTFALVVIASFLVGYLILGTDAYIALAEAALASLFFVSNWYFASGFDYFNEAQNQNLLLHTWSLAVEEQFYLLYPALIWAFGRRRSALRLAIGAVW